MRHRVRNYHPRQLTLVQRLDCVSTQDAVGDDGKDFRGAVLRAESCGGCERAACVGHVVNEDGDAGADGADEDHFAYFVGAGAFFVD